MAACRRSPCPGTRAIWPYRGTNATRLGRRYSAALARLSRVSSHSRAWVQPLSAAR